MFEKLAAAAAIAASAAGGAAQDAWSGAQLPLSQSRLQASSEPEPVSLRDASRDDRWLGLGVRTPRWSPDGRWLYFRWDLQPEPEEDPETDPWFRVDSRANRIEQLPARGWLEIPGPDLIWDPAGRQAAWTSGERLLLWSLERGTRVIFRAKEPARRPHFSGDGARLSFQLGEDLHQYDIAQGTLRQLTERWSADPEPTEAAGWLRGQQQELFERHRRAERLREQAEARRRRPEALPLQAVPAEPGWKIDRISISPGGGRLAVVYRKPAPPAPTRYLDFAAESGYAEVAEARPKVGEPQDQYRLGIVPYDPSVAPQEVEVRWVEGPADEKGTVPFGPYWNPEGDEALAQFVSLGFQDRWIGRLDLEAGAFEPLVHDHDDAWLGGPSPVAGYLNPALLEWLPGGDFVFASERSGWSHLYLFRAEGGIEALTRGEWEVRGAELSRDRTRWLIRASLQHPSDDHLYLLPARGGELRRLTEGEGRFQGWLAPDGQTLAVVHSETVHLPDLYLQAARPEAPPLRITRSGTDHFHGRRLVRPRIVHFPHPDGRPVWAALYLPEEASRNGAAVIHVHGGGYRQFSHRGWSVYGWEMHLGLVQHLVARGYVVADFDYRGGAGFGRDYRVDVYRSMGRKDVQGALAAVDYLVSEHGVERGRVGVYGLSYGGFFTLMALFQHPGVFAAGVANASVTDWAHYNHPWTARVLNLPYEDPAAYRASSPIYHAGGLADPLLLVHGLIDDNVQFQDAARLIQRLIELEKDFEVMVYPMERHVIRSESSRYDYVRRVTRFFRRHLLGREE